MTDEDILKKFWPNKISIFKRKYKADLVSEEELEYLDNRFEDSKSYEETLYRLKHGIFEKPTCPICGNKIPYQHSSGFNKFCSLECIGKDPNAKIARAKGLKEKWSNATEIGRKNIQLRNEKSNKTCMEKYGVRWYLTSKDCKEKTIAKLGVDNYWKSELNAQRTSALMKNNREIQAKREQTMIARYGNKSPYHTQLFYDTHDMSEIAYKGHLTKKRKGSFKQSDQEERAYQSLKEKFPDVIRQYRDKIKYPFICDFYIPSLDLFIELNFHWTHGGHPYNAEKDKEQLEFWKSKNSTYYDTAINTWTVRDVNKLETAKRNNLNYLVFYNEKEFKDWFEQQ